MLPKRYTWCFLIILVPACLSFPGSGGGRVGLEVREYRVQDDLLFISLEAAPEIGRVEVYINNELCPYHPVVTAGFDRILRHISHLDAGEHQVTVRAYDQEMNDREAGFKIDTVNISGGHYRAPRAAQPPAVDGRGDDACWEAAPWRSIKYLWLGKQPAPEDFSGRYKIVWTPERLYFLVEIIDDVLRDVRRDPLHKYWDYDCLEIFIDEDRSGGEHTYNHNAFAYHISLDYNVADLGADRKPRLFNDHIEVLRTRNGNKYTWELGVYLYGDTFDENSAGNIPVTLYPGKKAGFAVAYCDNDGGHTRKTFMGSIHIPGRDKNVAWQNAGVFGTLELLD